MAEYIEREAVVEAIMNQRLYYTFGDPNSNQGAYNMVKRVTLLDAVKRIPAADAIELLQKTQQLPRWIPVTERLPKAERKSYWVCTDTGYQCECRWTNNRFGIRELDEWGWCLFDIPPYQKVVAWMPLPCPYEPPEEE